MNSANHLPERGEELFRILSRFEYALKETGFGKVGRNEDVDVDWDGFANSQLGVDFLQSVREKGISPTLLTKPPSRQVLRSGKLDWAVAGAPQSVQDLFGAVRRVRNNLFHGGKSGDKDHGRNDALVAESIAVLLEALGTHQELRQMFEGRW
jgi:hypothetical protein